MGRGPEKYMSTSLPIVFCHGLLGWGDNELPDHPYFVWAHELKKTAGDSLPEFIFPSTGRCLLCTTRPASFFSSSRAD